MRQQGKANTMKSVLTIGDGISAWCLNFYLTKIPDISVTQFSQNHFISPCSLNSTAINCLRGTQKGLTPLGDLMVDSLSEFIDFNQTYQPDGVFEGEEIHLFNPNHQYNNRYQKPIELNGQYPFKGVKSFYREKAYLISPERLKGWFLKNSSGLETFTKFIIAIEPLKEGYKVLTQDGDYYFDEVYVASSYISKTLLAGIDVNLDQYMKYAKPVSGTYLEFEMDRQQIFKRYHIDSDICFDMEGSHLIFRTSEDKIIFGSTSDQSSIEYTNPLIFESLEQIRTYFEYELPEPSAWKQRTGIRFKGRKRTPYWGEISSGLFVVTGLYKNGYSFAFKAARDLIISQRTPF